MWHAIRNRSPLRYPGGKAKLGPFFRNLIRATGLGDGDYVEPYAGGAGVALDLLLSEHAWRIFVNDIDPAVWAFWRSVLDEPDELCRRIERERPSVARWKRHRAVYLQGRSASTIDLGFATLCLNRMNRSGILRGGMIGGYAQDSEWGVDARWNAEELVRRIRAIADLRERIHLSRFDALTFLKRVQPKLSKRALVYLDPPYFGQGHRLYENHYGADDHARLAEYVTTKLTVPWVVTYDDEPEIRALYKGQVTVNYELTHSARDARRGREVMFCSPRLVLPSATPWAPRRSPPLARRRPAA